MSDGPHLLTNPVSSYLTLHCTFLFWISFSNLPFPIRSAPRFPSSFVATEDLGVNLIQIIRDLFLLLDFSSLVRRGLIQASRHFIGTDFHSNEIVIFVFFCIFLLSFIFPWQWRFVFEITDSISLFKHYCDGTFRSGVRSGRRRRSSNLVSFFCWICCFIVCSNRCSILT